MTNYETIIIANSSCRVCLNHPNSYNVEIKGKHLQIFENCIGESITNGSTLLCFDCAKILEDFDQFRDNAIEANKLWNSRVYIFENALVKVENETDTEDHIDAILDEKECHMPCHDTLCDEKDTLEICTGENYAVDDIKVENEEHDNDEILIKIDCHEKPPHVTLRDENDYLDNCTEEIDFIVKSTRKYQSNKKTYRKDKIKQSDIIKTESKFGCGLCNFPVEDSLEIINKHVAEHFENNNLNCQLCDFQGFDFADMEGHRFVHQSHIKTIQCHICSKKTKTKSALIFHFRTKHINKNNECECPLCNKSYRAYGKWRLHQRCHTKTWKFECDTCARTFLDKSRLKNHIIETHLKIGCIICFICGKKVSRRYLQKHVQMVHDPSQQSIKCSHCNRTFKSHNHLKHHMGLINKTKTLTCPHCPKLFHDKNYRNQHVRFHTDSRPFRCTFCKSSYKVRGSLTIHMRKHSGERPFVCATCGNGFVSSTQLKRHIGMHSGNRGKQCSYCDRSFYDKRLLSAHVSKAHAQIGDSKK